MRRIGIFPATVFGPRLCRFGNVGIRNARMWRALGQLKNLWINRRILKKFIRTLLQPPRLLSQTPLLSKEGKLRMSASSAIPRSLSSLSKEEYPAPAGGGGVESLDLHRPYIDRVVLKCDKCGGQMSRIPEVVDAGWKAAVCRLRNCTRRLKIRIYSASVFLRTLS